jgi:predicted enzyme related to lactoylglutathione lyase
MSERFKTHGDFSWCELMTNDVEAAKKFYSALLGWTMEDMPMASGEAYTVAKAGDQGVGGVMKMPKDMPPGVPPHWTAYVTVTDVDAAAKKAEELGATTLVPPTDIPEVGKFYVFKDPQGAVLALMEYKSM